MEEHICGKKAVGKVIWVNGQEVNMCADHEAQARRIATALASTLTIIALGETEKTCESKTV